MKVDNILVEYLKDPIGIDIEHPRITWNDFDCDKQSAFEIEYSINGETQKNIHVKSSSMNYVFNNNFKSRDRVEFRIKIYNKNKECSDFSSWHHFEFGLLEKNDWHAKWISGNYKVSKKKRYPVDYFKKEFNANHIKKARLYISSCGLYEAFINNRRVGDFVLAPGSTDYKKRIQYQTYDVTSLIKNNENEIHILLADGWYRGSIGAKGFTNVFGTQTKVIAQLEIEDVNGKISVISTDESWSWSNDGPITFADLKDGEIVDNRLVPSYKNKALVTSFVGNLKASNNSFVIETNKSKPINSYTSPSGKHILEFKNNIAGYIAFKVNAHEGQKLHIVMGEMLDENNEVTLKNVQCVRKGKRTPLQEVTFICKEGINEYHSKFYYGGFKYLSIETDIEFDKKDFTQIQIQTELDETSAFKCSNKLINIFYENTLRSLKSNSIDIPTDCPTRERMGWTGDSQVFFESATFLTNYASFTRKHLIDVFDRQEKNGCLPQIAPYSAEDWFMGVMNGSVGWADVGILTPYRFYKKYGDIRILENNYDNMIKYINFMLKRCGRPKGIYAFYAKPLHLSWKNKKFGVNSGQSYGEWAEPNDVQAITWLDFAEPHPEESMAYTIWMLRLIIEISSILGKTENLEKYELYEKGITNAYQELVDKKRFNLDTNRQAKLVRPLYLKLLNQEQESFAKTRLLEALKFYNYRLGTGFLSTPFILNVLSSIDVEVAYKLLENEEMPGWLYMAKNSTGTIWEGWEGPKSQLGISSLNHYSKGALVEWLFNGMCGINVVKENEFLIKPIIGGKEKFATCTYQSIYGEIKSSWKKEDDQIFIDIDVPSNTKALFEYGTFKKVLAPGNHHFEF
ncbi:MAG: family 78 glycoside hydrolase catalytic domain [Bacilli bacterium]